MEGRNPVKHKSLGGLAEFLQASKLRPVFWRNPHGTCQVMSLFFSHLILNCQLLKDVADSDGPDGYISQSLWSFIRDSEREGQGSFLLDADDTVHLRLLLGGVYRAIKERKKEEEEEEKEEGDEKKKKKKNKNKKKNKKNKKKTNKLKFGIQPDSVSVTYSKIFEKLDDSKWKGRLYANVETLHTANEVCEMMEERTCMFIRTEKLPLDDIAKIVDRIHGRVAFIIALTVSSSTKNGYHAITVIYDSSVGKYLRCDNGYPRILDKVEKNRYLSEADPRVYRVKEAQVLYIATSLEEPAPKKDAFEKRVHRPRTRAEVTAMIREPEADALSGSEEEEDDVVGRDDVTEKEEEEVSAESHEEEEEENACEINQPNITFVNLPKLNEIPPKKDVTIKILANCGIKHLQWKGSLRDGKYYCSDPPSDVTCSNKSTGLSISASEEEVKHFLVIHRRCHRGTEPGNRRPDYPTQKKKGPRRHGKN